MKIILSILSLFITLVSTSQLPVGEPIDHGLPILKECHNCSNKTWCQNGRPEVEFESVLIVQSYTWEFTLVAPFQEEAWEFTSPTNDTKIPEGGLGNVVCDANQNWFQSGYQYDVRIKANYINGSSSDYGPKQCLSTAGCTFGGPFGPRKIVVNKDICEDKYFLKIHHSFEKSNYFEFYVYDCFDHELRLEIIDSNDQVVFDKDFILNNDPFKSDFKKKLPSGSYQVKVTFGQVILTETLLIN